MAGNSFGARGGLEVGGRSYEIFRLRALDSTADVSRLPFSLKILLENLLRNEGGTVVRAADVEALARFDPAAWVAAEIAFSPARVLMQDFTGVPAVVDLAAMRDAMTQLGGDPDRINPLVPPDTGIVHQVNLEYLARVVFTDEQGLAYPDTLVGTDSHTPMVNGLGVLGWGVGGIEAAAAMLGQPISMLT